AGGTDSSPMHFTGQVRDAATGLDHFPARNYTSAWGRWMTPDPLGLAVLRSGGGALLDHQVNRQDWDMYAYTLDDPATLTDLNGENACSPHDKSQSDCKVTVVVADRTKDKKGHYNDQFKNVKNQQNYNATARVYISYKGGAGQLQGTFLIRTTPSSSEYGTIAAGNYSGARVLHRGAYPAILLSSAALGARNVPALGGADPFTDEPFIHNAEIHRSGFGNITGFTSEGHAISEGCSVVACSQYPSFESATGLNAPAPQTLFAVTIEAAANGGAQ
ncbi:MAG: RHS repeat-associated core domain-containing protein, partial [Terriglobales bacterium]